MKLNILFLICIFAIFTIAYSKKVDKAVFVATKHHTDDEDERVNEDKGTPSCKRKLAKLQTEIAEQVGQVDEVHQIGEAHQA